MVKYPEVSLELVGQDGNAFSILGRAQKAARRAGLSREVIEKFMAEATSGDYNHLLGTTMEWFSCDESEEWEDDDGDY